MSVDCAQTVDVLICTYNRHELLKGVLQSLAGCEPPPDRILVVNGGDERADDVINSFKRAGSPIELIKTQNVNLAVSRNIGLRHCTGDIIAMTDDDAEVFPDWIGQILRAHIDHPDAGAIGGPVIGKGGDTITSRVADLTTFPNYKGFSSVRSLPGVNISYKKAASDEAGLYDPELFRGEDVDFNWRILKTGCKIFYDPAIRVYHNHRPTARGLIHQHYMYGRAYWRVRNKWPEMYSVIPRKMKSLSDVRKLAWFVIAPIIKPVGQAAALGVSAPVALPLLYAREYAWRWGIIQQAFFDRRKKISR